MTAISSMNGRKVAVLGAGGGIGQPLSLLLKSTPSSISKLSLYDLCNMGMAVDLSHIPTPVEISGYSGDEHLSAALNGCEIVVIPAGVPRKPGMTRNDLFNINAGIVKHLAAACAKTCPNAHVLIISNPVNSTVPIAYETMRNAGVSSPSVFGITTLDVIRAKTFIGQLKGVDPTSIKIDVIGGHSGKTILPVLSSSSIPVNDVSKDDIQKLIHRIQYGGDEVVQAKEGGGSATLSMAFAANQFIQNFIRALDGEKGIIENTFVKTPEGSSIYPATYFAGPVELGTKGIARVLPLPKLDSLEQEMLDAAISELKLNIEQGVNFVPSKL